MQRIPPAPAPVTAARVTLPTVSLLNGGRYVKVDHHDIRETFRRIKEQQATQ